MESPGSSIPNSSNVPNSTPVKFLGTQKHFQPICLLGTSRHKNGSKKPQKMILAIKSELLKAGGFGGRVLKKVKFQRKYIS